MGPYPPLSEAIRLETKIDRELAVTYAELRWLADPAQYLPQFRSGRQVWPEISEVP